MSPLVLNRDDVPSRDAGLPPDDEGRALVDRLYADHGAMLLSYVTRLTSDPYQAEDVVQETMLRAWRNAGRLTSGRGSVAGWLMRVAHNICVDRFRARRARPDEVAADAAAAPFLEDHASAVVDSVVVAKALSRLGPAHREVLGVVYFADRTAAEAAELLGLPVGTVKSRVHHALRRLRLHIDELMDDPA
ncbi:sigma-70 family RNA polymerase sigma factor [Actinoallomurus acaciae]|uniref:Sigma-70 family RNA polymerase sigma factor n=1 Tax=Actinoallomurus acaciae TaxID=502577 RepID=A0ABV5YVS1_9ACTN